VNAELYRAARDWATEHGHPQPDDRMLALVAGAALRDMADRIDRGGPAPLPPSVFSALVRERADDLAPSP
jgi:hypothetical protein